ncbi:hypothetical protein [Actinomadura geliboluensis]|uniref:hypothetical protein n=1 Tax=Actinomadura geliboluensis TaxID=882440 RepID=UPI003F4CC9BD
MRHVVYGSNPASLLCTERGTSFARFGCWVWFGGVECYEGESVKVDGGTAASASGVEGEALFVVVGVEEDSGALVDGSGDGRPEFGADAGGEGADVEAGQRVRSSSG